MVISDELVKRADAQYALLELITRVEREQPKDARERIAHAAKVKVLQEAVHLLGDPAVVPWAEVCEPGEIIYDMPRAA